MILPRTPQLLDDIFAAGILPDRGVSGYTGDAAVLEDADAHVRLEGLLALSELPASAREAAAILDVISVRANARDAWIPDAVPMAASKHGPSLLRELVRRPVPANDTIAVAGMRRATQKIARYHAANADAAAIVELISAVPQATPALAVAMLTGIAEGWPQETPPQLAPAQRAALAAAAVNASPELLAAFTLVAARWALPGVFKPE